MSDSRTTALAAALRDATAAHDLLTSALQRAVQALERLGQPEAVEVDEALRSAALGGPTLPAPPLPPSAAAELARRMKAEQDRAEGATFRDEES